MVASFRCILISLLTAAVSPALLLTMPVTLLFNLIGRLSGRFKPVAQPDERAPAGPASIVILNWNGRDLLSEGLPSVLRAAQADGLPHEIIVVDNGSSDGSADFVRSAYPGVRLIALPRNLGFGEGNNVGVRAAQHDIVVLLNNDMLVDPGFLRPLLEGFGTSTFAVSSQIFLQNPEARREETGKTSATFRRGMFDFTHREVNGELHRRPYYPALWAGGGSSAFHRKRFMELGGFHPIYAPAYVEDTDLSYRAWKAGWEVLFAPASIVYHKHRASSSRRFHPGALEALVRRNQLLFTWKNLTSWRLLLLHSLCLPWNCYRLARDFGLSVWQGIFAAAVRALPAGLARLREPYRTVRSDSQILELFAMPGLYFDRRRPAQKSSPPQHGDAAKIPQGTPRLLWLTAYLPHLGRHAGAGRMYQLLQRLAGRYRITLLTFLETEGEREFLAPLESLCERVVAMRRTPPRRWQLFAYEPFDEFHTAQMESAFQECLEHQDFGLIQLEYTQMACYPRRQFHIPILLTKHEVDFAACLRRSRTETRWLLKLRWFYNYLQVLDREMRLLQPADAVICMTDADRQELRRFSAGAPLHVINTGVDLDFFRPVRQAAERQRLVFVGAFQHHPNVDAMLHFCRRTLPRIRARIPAAELCIVGSNPPQQVHELHRLPGVEVTGYVPDIRPHMASAMVYVVPLRLGVGIRGKILEAWAMGMPVVATSVAAAGLLAEDGGNILIADDDEQFAEHVIVLLQDRELRNRLGRSGRAMAEKHYGWDAAAEKLDALCRQLLDRGDGTRGPVP